MGEPAGQSVKSRTWISVWYAFSALIIAWDAGYCFLRPRSMVGGDLHWIWKPYALYAQIDYVYGWPSVTRGDGFANAQSFMNVIETMINLAYVYYARIRPSAIAPLVGFSVGVELLFNVRNDANFMLRRIGTSSSISTLSLALKTMMSDYRTVLYRLDLATSYPTIHALLQHFMNESPIDGTLELRVVTSPSTGSPHIPTPPRSPNPHAPHTMMSAPEHYMSFARSEDGREVYARHTFGIPPDPELNVSPSSPTQRSIYARTPVLAVTHEFAPRTSIITAFIPVIEHFLRTDHELASVIFECRSYLQPAEQENSHPLEILDRPVPYKRMFGYVGRVRGGMTIYELDDTVTGTMFSSIPVNFPLPP